MISSFLRSAQIVAFCWLWFFSSSSSAQVSDGSAYSLENRSWEGLSGLAELMSKSSIAFDAPQIVDVRDLPVNDVLIIVYPQKLLEREGDALELTNWVRAGGRILLFDDFGSSGNLLSHFGISRHDIPETGRRFQDRAALPIADATGVHPLTQSAYSLVFNHASSLAARGKPVYAFDNGKGAVYDMRLQSGILVAVSDASLVTNLMLSIQPNKKFVENALAVACEGRANCAVHVLTRDDEVIGRFGEEKLSLAVVRKLIGDKIRSIESIDLTRTLNFTAQLLVVGTLALLLLVFSFRAAPIPNFTPGKGRAIRGGEYEHALTRHTGPGAHEYSLPMWILADRFESAFYPAIGLAGRQPMVTEEARRDAVRRYLERFEPRADRNREREITNLVHRLSDTMTSRALNRPVVRADARNFLKTYKLCRSILLRLDSENDLESIEKRPT